jgi:hypothetical protein
MDVGVRPDRKVGRDPRSTGASVPSALSVGPGRDIRPTTCPRTRFPNPHFTAGLGAYLRTFLKPTFRADLGRSPIAAFRAHWHTARPGRASTTGSDSRDGANRCGGRPDPSGSGSPCRSRHPNRCNGRGRYAFCKQGARGGLMLRQLMRAKRATRALRRGLPRWRSARVRRGYGSRICRRVVRACKAAEVRRPLQAAVGAALRQTASARRLIRTRRTPAAVAAASVARPAPAYGPGEKGTLEVGSWIVLGTLGLGVEFGRWPAWTALAAAAGYMLWAVAYSEATVQARRRWPEARRLALPRAGSEQPAATPPQEHSPA